MIKGMTEYFTAEKQESLLFMLVGAFAIAVAIWLWLNGHRLKSIAYPLIAIALIQLVVGSSVYFRTDNQLAQLRDKLATAPAATTQAELTRMNVVMQGFSLYKTIEIALLIVGAGLLALMQRSDFAAGIGAGLVVQSAFMLCLDMFAEARGQDYVKTLGAAAN